MNEIPKEYTDKDAVLETEDQEIGFHICGDCIICKTKIIAN